MSRFVATFSAASSLSLSAGSAVEGQSCYESASKAFEPLETVIDKEGILNHYLVRISHDATEALVSTIAEQHIDLLITEFDTFRTNKALHTLVTCNVLAILAGGTSDDEIIFEEPTGEAQAIRAQPKTMVVVYDGGDHSDMVLKAASWLEHSGRFNVTVLSIKKKDDSTDEIKDERQQQVKYLKQIGVEFTEAHISEVTENNPEKCAELVYSSINSLQPDLVLTGLTIGKFSVLDNTYFASMLDRLNCPAIVARTFVIPGISRVRTILVSALEKILH